MRKIFIFLFIFILSFLSVIPNTQKKVLFIGNSLTAGMPNVVDSIAQSKGDSLYFIHHSGAQSLDTVDQYTKEIIESEKWDYVVVQYNYKIDKVNEVIKKSSPCTQTVVYMMWGWKNGNNSTLTYFEQQDKFRTTYINTANRIKGLCAPAGMSWNTVRKEKPWIELYGGDNYHPNSLGIYLTACTFYSVFFEESSVGAVAIGIQDSTAKYFQEVSSTVVLDSLDTWNINKFVPNNSPRILKPKKGTLVESSLVDFEWENDSKIDSYELQLFSDSNYKNNVFSEEKIISNNLTRELGIYNLKVFGRLRGLFTDSNNIECQTSWHCFDFYIPPGGPKLFTPIDNKLCSQRQVTFTWENYDNSDSYLFQAAIDSNFKTILLEKEIYNNAYFHSFNTDSELIYWRVQDFKGFISNKWSEHRRLNLKKLGPSIISPLKESNNISSQEVVLKWTPSKENFVGTYNIQISDENDFENSIIIDDIIEINEFIFEPRRYNQKFYWRVLLNDTNCKSSWSEVNNFKTKLEPTELLLPKNNSQLGTSFSCSLEWNPRKKDYKHDVLVSLDSNFSNAVLYKENLSESNAIFKNLLPSSKYYWKVLSFYGKDTSEYSEVWEFETNTIPHEKITLVSPKNNSTNLSIEMTLEWELLNEADFYTIEIAKDKNFNSIVELFSGLKKNKFELSNLEYNQKYYWRVKYLNSEFESKWSDIWAFGTKKESNIIITKLLSPGNGDSISTNNIVFKWSQISGIDNYNFQLSKSKSFVLSDVINNETVMDTSVELNNLEKEKQYFWRVRAVDSEISGAENWSNIHSVYVNNVTTTVEKENGIISLFPNPNKGEFNIRTDFLFSNIKIKNYLGETVYYLNTGLKKEIKLDIKSRISSGVYFIEIIGLNKKIVKQILIQ